ncbi:MAG: hypothetical protein ACRYFX_07790 [Janthinobacterium lividum]
MKLQLTTCCLALALLAGCSSNSEKQGVDAVTGFYGGTVRYSKGSHFSTDATEPQGEYLEVALDKPGLNRHFSDPRIPASNCAYLVYKQLAPTERQDYSYLKVTLTDSGTTHGYTYPVAGLQLATQAANLLTPLMANLQQHHYHAIANNFNPVGLRAMSPDSLTSLITRIGKEIGPITAYALQGHGIAPITLAGKPQQLVRLFVRISEPAPTRKLLIVVNPSQKADEKYIYGLNFFN